MPYLCWGSLRTTIWVNSYIYFVLYGFVFAVNNHYLLLYRFFVINLWNKKDFDGVYRISYK